MPSGVVDRADKGRRAVWPLGVARLPFQVLTSLSGSNVFYSKGLESPATEGDSPVG
jgi:hypothetical protein